ncbi:rolling circle replication-associated protein [Oleiagrimonas soli]|uniref:Replication-associated protein ORF2/G2P domain-containing protein n=1 Tax=Oleiagrimonas soli TaxID=1543381 RepID=A0A841KDK9_9GAMM|nr:hypothetical protein [Oleiagrimonas soli]MBB6183282.1 hypothetical protein [Oleiagrimonas soli]
MIAVCRDANRIKRLRINVGHSGRLLHFQAHTERSASRWNIKMLTLTYRTGDQWQKLHISQFRDRLRQWFKRRGLKCRFVWVAELQKRGVLHYHMIVWVPKGYYLPSPDKSGWWPHGMSNVRSVKSSAVGYLMKYASKTTPDDAMRYPKGARMHGAGGLDPEDRRHLRYWRSPIWVREAMSGRSDIRKVNGGYCDKFTGEFLRSPWRIYIGPGGQVWTFKATETTQ